MAKRPTPKQAAARRPAVRKPVARKTSSHRTARTALTTRKKTARKVPKPAAAARRGARLSSPLFAPLKGAERRDIGHVRLEIASAGAARVKRMIYPAGFHWAVDMKPVTGTELCMHAHVGFLAHGEIHIEYADGCIVEFKAPQVVAIEPGHDGWVVGKEPVVLIEFDFGRDTVDKLGMSDAHRHGQAK